MCINNHVFLQFAQIAAKSLIYCYSLYFCLRNQTLCNQVPFNSKSLKQTRILVFEMNSFAVCCILFFIYYSFFVILFFI